MNANVLEPQGILSSDDIRLLGEIGLMAAGAGNGKAAEAIFQGLMVLRPNRALPYIGLSMAKQCLGATDEALRILSEDGLRANPDSDEILVFLGMTLNNARRDGEGKRVLQDMLAKPAADSSERRMARKFLAETGRNSGIPPLARAGGENYISSRRA